MWFFFLDAFKTIFYRVIIYRIVFSSCSGYRLSLDVYSMLQISSSTMRYNSLLGCFFMGGSFPNHFCCLNISFLLTIVSADFVENSKIKTILLFTVLELRLYGTERWIWWDSHGQCLAQREASFVYGFIWYGEQFLIPFGWMYESFWYRNYRKVGINWCFRIQFQLILMRWFFYCFNKAWFYVKC